MPETIIENLAKSISDKVNEQIKEKDRFGIDPITIIMIIAIIVNVIRVIQECNKDKTSTLSTGEKAELLSTDVKFRSFNHSFFTRLKLRRILKNQLTKDQYKIYGDTLVKVLLETGKTVKEEQVSALLEYKNV